MKNVIEILERQYQSFINQERDWNFFLGLADYVEFINKTPDFKEALSKIKEKKEKEIKIIEKLEKEAVIELQKIKKELLEIIKTEKFTCEGLPEALLKLEDYEKGKIDSNHYKSSRLNEGLRNLIKVLAEKEGIRYEELVKNYSLLKYSISKKLLLRMGKSLEFQRKKEIELWGAYDKLQLVFRLIKLGEKYLSTFKKDLGEYDEYLELLKEMEIIKNNGKRPFFSSLPSPKRDTLFDYRKKELKKDNYKLYTTRIHNYLIQELSKKESEETIKKEVKGTILYLNQNGDLYREPKDKYCYPMGEKSNRHKIIRFLATNKGYQLTKFISAELGIESEKTIRTEIGKMRNNIKKYLKIDGKDFLQSKKGSGYRINPKYKIVLKNE